MQLLITINGIYDLYESDKSFFIENQNYFKNYIQDKQINKLYKQILTNINSLEQKGGSLSSLAIGGIVTGTSSSCILTTIIGYFIYKWLSNNYCNKSYPITLRNSPPPTVQDIIQKLFPFKLNISTSNPYEYINQVGIYISNFQQILSVIKGSNIIEKTGWAITRIAASAGLAIGTGGTGGDIIISYIYTILSALEVILSILNELTKQLNNEKALRILNDMFAINFAHGPKDVKCWTLFVLNHYNDDPEYFILLCNFYNIILPTLSDFIGNMLSDMIPNSLGLPAFLTPLIIRYAKNNFFTQMERQLMSNYNMIPYDLREILQHPERLGKYIQRKAGTGVNLIPNDIYQLLLSNGILFGYILHKLVAFMYATIYIFSRCSKIIKIK